MKTCMVRLESVSDYSQSRYHNTEKLEKEAPEDWEKRTWRNKLNLTSDGHVFIPPQAFKNCLSEAAKYLGMKIPGKRNATYTKHFVSGIMVTDPLILPDTAENVRGEWLHVPSTGVRGGSKRVLKCFPVIRKWGGEVVFYILDDTVTEKIFEYHLEQAGKFVGIGRFRPSNNGYYGRFKIASEILFQ